MTSRYADFVEQEPESPRQVNQNSASAPTRNLNQREVGAKAMRKFFCERYGVPNTGRQWKKLERRLRQEGVIND